MARDPVRTLALRKARAAKREGAGLMSRAEVAALVGVANPWRAWLSVSRIPGCPAEVVSPSGRVRGVERVAFTRWWAGVVARADALSAEIEAQRAA